MARFPTPPNNTRLGFHYFPDTIHYRENELVTWVPELRALGASWLTLLAPLDRAIPESFLCGLLKSGIEPVLHFHLPLESQPRVADLGILFSTYARWGVHYVVLFDQPNQRAAWPVAHWVQNELVEQFLDRYLSLALPAIESGLIPVFPPLTPGGDYWDTVFLRTALQDIQRRGHSGLLDRLVLSAYAFAGERPLNWGVGGPERWPGTRPYHVLSNNEDQRGFRIFDWYLAVAQAVLGHTCPIILFGLGSGALPDSPPNLEMKVHLNRTMTIAQALVSLSISESSSLTTAALNEPFDPLPPEIISGNFWLLAAGPKSSHASRAWFQSNGAEGPTVAPLRRWVAAILGPSARSDHKSFRRPNRTHPISHYLLLPAYDWGISDWHLNAVKPFVKKYRPTLGFSLAEAILAGRVTVVGNPEDFPDEALDELRVAGCLVERISGDGMSIATQLADK